MSHYHIAKTMPVIYNKYKQHVGGVPMKYIEDVHWILDKPGTTIHNQDEQFKENICFPTVSLPTIPDNHIHKEVRPTNQSCTR